MKDKFLSLMSLILEEKVEGRIEDYRGSIANHVNELNEFLNLEGREERFRAIEFKDNEEKIIPPVVFTSSGENIKFVVFGLNPRFDAKNVFNDNLT